MKKKMILTFIILMQLLCVFATAFFWHGYFSVNALWAFVPFSVGILLIGVDVTVIFNSEQSKQSSHPKVHKKTSPHPTPEKHNPTEKTTNVPVRHQAPSSSLVQTQKDDTEVLFVSGEPSTPKKSVGRNGLLFTWSGGSVFAEAFPAILGSSAEMSSIHIPGHGVSRQHARIRCEQDCYYISDLHSLNGTVLNGLSIRSEVSLNHGDTIVLGGEDVRVEVKR